MIIGIRLHNITRKFTNLSSKKQRRRKSATRTIWESYFSIRFKRLNKIVPMRLKVIKNSWFNWPKKLSRMLSKRNRHNWKSARNSNLLIWREVRPKSRWSKSTNKKKCFLESINWWKSRRISNSHRKNLRKNIRFTNSRKITIWRTLQNSKRSKIRLLLKDKKKFQSIRRLILRNCQCSQFRSQTIW